MRPGDFGWALSALKAGELIRRSGWNGKGMYLFLLEAADVQRDWIKTEPLGAIADANGGSVKCHASIRMLCADGSVLTGWTPNTLDVFAEDWEIAE